MTPGRGRTSAGQPAGGRLDQTFGWARDAAARVAGAQLGAAAVATARPRSVLGIVRSRAPLALLLYVAAQEGRVVEQDNGGFAVLSRPALDKPAWPAGYRLGALRRLDRGWDLAVFAIPPALGLLFAVFTALSPATRLVAVPAAVAALLWVVVFLTAMVASQLRWMARMGAPPAAGRERGAQSLPGDHWSVPLVHQPDPSRADDLIRLLTERLTGLVRAELQVSGRGKVRVGRPDVTETLVILTGGITTGPTRSAMARSLQAIRGYPTAGDVIVLSAPGRMERITPRPIAGGGFVLLYAAALAVVIAVTARLVADQEARVCRPASCAGHPATYATALRWLLQRLLFSDPPGMSPGTTPAVLLGWLISLASAVGVVVLAVAVRQEIAQNKGANAAHTDALRGVIAAAQILILVVTEGERDAVLEAARARVQQDAVVQLLGERVVYRLGPVAGNELWLAQAGEQGWASAAGMLATASDAIRSSRPDYVIATGICYGLRRDEGQRTGDIVVARRLVNLDHVKETDDPARPVVARGVNVGCSPEFLSRFQAGQATWRGARVHIGTVLSSNKLVDSERLVRRLREDYPDAIAGEMEGIAVHEAATRDVKPDWILVKGISDWGYEKTGQAQATAAANAAGFVLHVIAGGALRRTRG